MISIGDLINFIQIEVKGDYITYNPFRHKKFWQSNNILYYTCKNNLSLLLENTEKLNAAGTDMISAIKESFVTDSYYTCRKCPSKDQLVMVFVPINTGDVSEQEAINNFLDKYYLSNIVIRTENIEGGYNHIHMVLFSGDINPIKFIDASCRLFLNAREFVPSNSYEAYKKVAEVYLLNKFRFQDIALGNEKNTDALYKEFDRIVNNIDIYNKEYNSIDIEHFDRAVCNILKWINNKISFPVNPSDVEYWLLSDALNEVLRNQAIYNYSNYVKIF